MCDTSASLSTAQQPGQGACFDLLAHIHVLYFGFAQHGAAQQPGQEAEEAKEAEKAEEAKEAKKAEDAEEAKAVQESLRLCGVAREII